jgi:hypothetical protein
MSSDKYKHKLNEAFYNSDFTNMSQNLQMYQMQEAKKQNSKRKKSQKSKENYSKDQYGSKMSNLKIDKLSKNDKREILKNRDFNFELGQEFLESRYVAYQSKDLKYSLKNAKEIERSLMQLKLDESDEGKQDSDLFVILKSFHQETLKTNDPNSLYPLSLITQTCLIFMPRKTNSVALQILFQIKIP